MKKKTVVSVMVVAMLFAVSLFFVGGTYARYVSSFEGTSTVAIAKWAVALKEGTESMDLELEAESQTGYVVEGKIAPSYSASGVAEINLNGTEVAVDILAEVDKTEIASKLTSLGFATHPEDIQTSVVVEKGDDATFTIEAEPAADGTKDKPYVIKLPGNNAFGENDTVKVTIKVTWDNADDGHNDEHTAVGTSASDGTKLEVPVKLYVVQHIEEKPYQPPTA